MNQEMRCLFGRNFKKEEEEDLVVPSAVPEQKSYDHLSNPWNYFFVCVVFVVIPVFVCVWMGGLKAIRRMVLGGTRAKYDRLADLEK